MSTSADPQRLSPVRSADAVTAANRLRLVGPDETVASHADGHDRAFGDEERDLQSHALALESHCLRRSVERYVEVLECGGVVEAEHLVALQRAFRAYRPFVFAHDREQNDAAKRRLARAVAAARSQRADASVA